jgi:hypothetical protein
MTNTAVAVDPPTIDFVRARSRLSKSLGQIPSIEEIAMWVSLGSANEGLSAYVQQPNGTYVPAVTQKEDWDAEEGSDEQGDGDCEAPVFDVMSKDVMSKDVMSKDGFDYRVTVQCLHFNADELRNFEPADRYVTHAQAVDRCRQQTGQAEEALRALLARAVVAGHLTAHHPVAGRTLPPAPTGLRKGDVYPPGDFRDWPGIEQALFTLRQLDEVERKWRGSESVETPSYQGALISTDQLKQHFKVKTGEEANKRWWRDRTSHPQRSPGLLDCRASKGAGRGKPAQFYLVLIVAWLVDQEILPKAGVRRVLKEHFPECQDEAEQQNLDYLFRD